MSKLDTTIDFYSGILHDLSLSVVGDGLVTFINKDGDSKPVCIGGKRLCLPTKALLKEAQWDERVVFHPLAEQFSTNLSPVLDATKNYVVVSLTMKMSIMLVALAELIADPSRHKGLSSKAAKLLKQVGELDDKTVAAVKSILRKISSAPETRLVNVLLKNGDDEKALRTCVITFPIVEALEQAAAKEDTNVFGMKTLRKLDLAPLATLFRYVAGETVLQPSNDRTAPYFEALLVSWRKVAEHVNTLVETFQSKVPAIKDIGGYTLDWVQHLDNFADFANKHHGVAPPLPGNRPIVIDEEVLDVVGAQTDRAFEGNDVSLEVRPTRQMSIKDRDLDGDDGSIRRSRPQQDDIDRPSVKQGRSVYDFGHTSTPRRGRDDDRHSRRDREESRFDRSRRDQPRRRSINDW